jgi:hypothetical protein
MASTGLAMKSWKPLCRNISSLPVTALAVIAIMVTLARAEALDRSKMALEGRFFSYFP